MYNFLIKKQLVKKGLFLTVFGALALAPVAISSSCGSSSTEAAVANNTNNTNTKADPETTKPNDTPVTNPVNDPVTNPTTDPVANPTTDPVANPTTNPATTPTTNPSTTPTTNPVTTPTTNPATTPTTNPATTPTTNPATTPTTNPTTPTTNPTKPTTNPTTPTTNPTTPTTNPATTPTTNPATTPTTNPVTTPPTNPVTPPVTNPQPVVRLANKVLFSNFIPSEASTNEVVVWSTIPTDPTIQKVEFYYSDTTKTLEELKALGTTDWKPALPTKVNQVHESRFLWVKMTPATGYSLEESIIEITIDTRIATIRTKMASVPTTDLEKVQVDLDKSNNNEVKWAKSPLAAFDKYASAVMYLMGDQYTDDKKADSALNSAWTTVAPTTANVDPAKRHLWIKVIPSAKYLIDKPMYEIATTSKLAKVKSIVDKLSDEEMKKLGYLQVDEYYPHINVQYKGQTRLSNRVSEKLKFLTGSAYDNEKTVALAPDYLWTDTPPSTIELNKGKRHLWVKITPSEGYEFKQTIYDITWSSHMSNVPIAIDGIDPTDFAKVDLSKFVFSGGWDDLRIKLPRDAGFEIPPHTYLSVLFRTKDGSPLGYTESPVSGPLDEIVKIISNDISYFTRGEFTVALQLIAKPEDKDYQLIDHKTTLAKRTFW